MLTERVNDVEILLSDTEGLFSPRGLDRGTRAMLTLAEIRPGMKVLDLGCGAGPVGIYAAKLAGSDNVLFTDIDPRAVEAAKKNARLNGIEARAVVSDGFVQINEAGFDLILSNPPYQSDFAVAKKFIEKGFNRLKIGGVLMMVTKRRAWYENKLKAIFGGVKTREIDGYFVFIAEKRKMEYASKAQKK